MSQNISHAVMAQRSEPHDSLDHFPTPPWATRALCEHVIDISGCSVWEPACGNGDMAGALGEYTAAQVWASDVHDYGVGVVHDFLWPRMPWLQPPPIDWIITNPAFRLAEQFILRGRQIARVGVAMLVRSVFIESVGRWESLFRNSPPDIMAQFVERVPMVKGRLDRRASTATSYCWLVWKQERETRNEKIERSLVPHSSFLTSLVWIPPCRAKLERDGDYR